MSATKVKRAPIGATVLRWIAASAFLAIALLGWRGVTRIPVRSVVVHGAERASEADLLALGRVPIDSALYELSGTIVADRVRRHPWVEDATVSRLPTGTVSIRITEREPVLLALSTRGEPEYFIDASGHRMPWTSGGPWRVPVLTGLQERYHPVVPVRNAAVRALAAALSDLDRDVDALLSEFHVDADGGLSLRTTVTPAGQTVQVRLGRAEPAGRLARLRAFWDQVVLARPDARFSWVDLRFDSQIVTSESS